jgi:hypothetical protein
LAAEADALLPGAGRVIGRCVVWQDFEKSWEEQPFQFPDAGALIPELESLLKSAAPGRGETEILARILPHPGSPPPTRGSTRFVPITPSLPGKKSRTKSRPWLPIGAGAALAMAGISWFFLPRMRAEVPKISESIPAMAAASGAASSRLEPLTESKPAQPLAAAILQKPGKPREKEAAAIGPNPNPPMELLDSKTFLELQSQVRTDPYAALSSLKAAKAMHPDSPDLGFLECEARTRLAQWTPELRQEIARWLDKNPAFLDRRLFRENLRYWLWKNDLHAFRQNPGNGAARQNLAASANAYLGEFGDNPQLRAKITQVSDAQ